MSVQVTEIDIEAVKLSRVDGRTTVSLKLGPAGVWVDVIDSPNCITQPIEVSASEIEDLAMAAE